MYYSFRCNPIHTAGLLQGPPQGESRGGDCAPWQARRSVPVRRYGVGRVSGFRTDFKPLTKGAV